MIPAIEYAKTNGAPRKRETLRYIYTFILQIVICISFDYSLTTMSVTGMSRLSEM